MEALPSYLSPPPSLWRLSPSSPAPVSSSPPPQHRYPVVKASLIAPPKRIILPHCQPPPTSTSPDSSLSSLLRPVGISPSPPSPSSPLAYTPSPTPSPTPTPYPSSTSPAPSMTATTSPHSKPSWRPWLGSRSCQRPSASSTGSSSSNWRRRNGRWSARTLSSTPASSTPLSPSSRRPSLPTRFGWRGTSACLAMAASQLEPNKGEVWMKRMFSSFFDKYLHCLYLEVLDRFKEEELRPYLWQVVVRVLVRKMGEAEQQFDKYRGLVLEGHPFARYFDEFELATKVLSQFLNEK